MFRIVCYVEDKHLPKVLHALAGLVLNMDPPQPVTNAVVIKPSKANGALPAIKEASPTGTSFKGQLIDHLATKKGSRLTSQDLRDQFTSAGGNPNSVNGVLINQLIEEKVIKRVGRGLFVAL